VVESSPRRHRSPRALLCGERVRDAFVLPQSVENPGVVPTWNYVAAEVRGRLTLRDDPEWTARQVRAVTETSEAGRVPQWRVDDRRRVH